MPSWPLVDPALFTVENAIRRGAVVTDLLRSLTPARWAADGPAYLEHLARVAPVTRARTRVVGYCMGGRLGLALAAQRPDRVRTVAAFHPGGLVTDEPGSPHRLLPLVRSRLYFAFADNDPGMPPEAVARFVSSARAARCKLTSEVYAGAAHGFTMADLPAYSAVADARHWSELERVFAA
jgi:carboxymethylenebutenolidase